MSTLFIAPPPADTRQRTTDEQTLNSANLVYASRLDSVSRDAGERGRLSNPVLRRLTDAEIEELIQQYRDGDSIDKLSHRYKVHRTSPSCTTSHIAASPGDA